MTADKLFFAIILAVWLVAVYAMIKMLVAGFQAGERLPMMIFNPTFLVATYNRRNFRVFLACVLTGVAIAVVYDALLLAGYIRR